MNRTSSACNRLLAALLGGLAACTAGAADGGSPLLDSAVLDLLDPAASGDQPVVIEQPARLRRELAAVIDGRPDDGGLPRVMAVTPGGAADRMGLRAGDRLLRINNVDLGADATMQLRAAVDAGPYLALDVQRGGQEISFGGNLDAVAIPAYRLEIAASAGAEAGCGRISVVLKPPASMKVYPALLHEIDGRLAGPSNQEVFRLPSGRHVLKVSELIDGDRFSGVQNLQRSKLLRHERFKYLEIDVRPDTTYRLGVRWNEDNRSPIREQGYWEPVIWKEVSESCG